MSDMAEVQLSTALHLFLESLGDNLSPCLTQVLKVTTLLGPFLNLQTHQACILLTIPS